MNNLWLTIKAAIWRYWLQDEIIWIKISSKYHIEPALFTKCVCDLGVLIYLGKNYYLPVDFTKEDWMKRYKKPVNLETYDFSKN